MSKLPRLRRAGATLRVGLLGIAAACFLWGQANAADDLAPAKPAAVAGPPGSPPEAEPPTPDASFEVYVPLSEIEKAVAGADAAALADAALQVAEGERVLLRTHKSGVTSAFLAEKAAELAARKRDKATLGRLVKAGERFGGDKLKIRLAALDKLAGQARDVDPALLISVEDVAPDGFGVFRSYLNALERAKFLGDRQGLAEAEEQLRELTDLPPRQIEYLAGLAEAYKKDVPEKADDAGRLLARLAAASRDDDDADDSDSDSGNGSDTGFGDGTGDGSDERSPDEVIEPALPSTDVTSLPSTGASGLSLVDPNMTKVKRPRVRPPVRPPAPGPKPRKVVFHVLNKCPFDVRVQIQPGGRPFVFHAGKMYNGSWTTRDGSQPSITLLGTGAKWRLDSGDFQVFKGKDGVAHWSLR